MDWSTRRLCLLFTPAACVDDPWKTLDTCLDAGLPLVQWRVKEDDPAGLERCLTSCRERDVPLIVNDDVLAAAKAPSVAGAHVGQDDMPAPAARERLRPGQVLGVSTHDPGQAERAIADGADYVGVGPCFATATKGYTTGLPGTVVREVLVVVGARPAFAIGGITVARIAGLRTLGCEHIAVSQAVLGAPRPDEVVAEMLRELE